MSILKLPDNSDRAYPVPRNLVPYTPDERLAATLFLRIEQTNAVVLWGKGKVIHGPQTEGRGNSAKVAYS